MKVKAGTVIKRYNEKPVMTEQEIMLDENGRPVVVNGQPLLANGREMTVGDVVSQILSTKRVEQFNILKADVLARRFYRVEVVDIDEADLAALIEVIDHNDQFFPFVLATVKRVLIEARDGQEKVTSRARD